MVAVWKRSCTDLSEDLVRRILEPLASPPGFHLPASREAHTRHYVPWEKKGPSDRTLIFDSFVSIGRDSPLFIHWAEVDLAEEDLATLRRLVENLPALGRAESWVQAEVVETPELECNCIPRGEAESDGETVYVLCADPSSAFAADRYPTHDPKKIKKGLAAADLLFDCPAWHLCMDTETIHQRRWSDVPGARWIAYRRQIAPLSSRALASPTSVRENFTVARFLLDGPVLPSKFATLPLAELVRHALMSKYQFLKRCEANGGPPQAGGFPKDAPLFRSLIFSGKDASGVPLRDNRGAFFLPSDEDGDDLIDHVTVYAEAGLGGLDSFEVRALDALRKLRFEDRELEIRLIGLGRAETFSGGVIGPAKTWESETPFLATRHLKRRGRRRDPREWFDSPEGRNSFVLQVLRESLERRGIFGAEVTPLDRTDSTRPLQFRLFRRKSDDDGGRRPRGLFRIRLAAPIRGPIAVGHSSHFGLGLFLPR